MQINKESHVARLWKVHNIAKDFALWDVWEVPIAATNTQTENFQSFYKVTLATLKTMETKTTVVSFLFTLRYWISNVIPLDKNVNTLPIPGCTETTVKSRLTREELEQSKTGKAIQLNTTDLEFRPVYLFQDESLHEISNDTVHGLIHFGWIKKNDNFYTASLAIYVIPRGMIGKVYLKLIEPFRRYIVYPAMMKSIKAIWQEYLLNKGNI